MTEISRRKVTQGIAWSVPAVAVATIAPAFAASPVGPVDPVDPPVTVVAQISTTGWTFTANSFGGPPEARGFGRPGAAFDGNLETFWHSCFDGATMDLADCQAQEWGGVADATVKPIWIQAEASTPFVLSEIRMHARPLSIDGTNGASNLANYDIQVLQGGVWVSVKTGTLPQSPDWQTVTLNAPVTTTAVRIVTTDTHENANKAVVGEIQFWGPQPV